MHPFATYALQSYLCLLVWCSITVLATKPTELGPEIWERTPAQSRNLELTKPGCSFKKAAQTRPRLKPFACHEGWEEFAKDQSTDLPRPASRQPNLPASLSVNVPVDDEVFSSYLRAEFSPFEHTFPQYVQYGLAAHPGEQPTHPLSSTGLDEPIPNFNPPHFDARPSQDFGVNHESSYYPQPAWPPAHSPESPSIVLPSDEVLLSFLQPALPSDLQNSSRDFNYGPVARSNEAPTYSQSTVSSQASVQQPPRQPEFPQDNLPASSSINPLLNEEIFLSSLPPQLPPVEQTSPQYVRDGPVEDSVEEPIHPFPSEIRNQHTPNLTRLYSQARSSDDLVLHQSSYHPQTAWHPVNLPESPSIALPSDEVLPRFLQHPFPSDLQNSSRDFNYGPVARSDGASTDSQSTVPSQTPVQQSPSMQPSYLSSSLHAESQQYRWQDRTIEPLTSGREQSAEPRRRAGSPQVTAIDEVFLRDSNPVDNTSFFDRDESMPIEPKTVHLKVSDLTWEKRASDNETGPSSAAAACLERISNQYRLSRVARRYFSLRHSSLPFLLFCDPTRANKLLFRVCTDSTNSLATFHKSNKLYKPLIGWIDRINCQTLKQLPPNPKTQKFYRKNIFEWLEKEIFDPDNGIPLYGWAMDLDGSLKENFQTIEMQPAQITLIKYISKDESEIAMHSAFQLAQTYYELHNVKLVLKDDLSSN